MTDDLFVGEWEMDPASNQYEWGTPPQAGRYLIAPVDAGYLITMHWTTADGQAREMAYSGIPDGEWYPVADNPAVDAMSMTRVDERTLVTDARLGVRIVATGRRLLSQDGQSMTIHQSGMRPDGKPYTNTSVYRRIHTAADVP